MSCHEHNYPLNPRTSYYFTIISTKICASVIFLCMLLGQFQNLQNDFIGCACACMCTSSSSPSLSFNFNALFAVANVHEYKLNMASIEQLLPLVNSQNVCTRITMFHIDIIISYALCTLVYCVFHIYLCVVP